MRYLQGFSHLSVVGNRLLVWFVVGMDLNAMTDHELVDEFLAEHPGVDDNMRLALWVGRKVAPEDWPDVPS